MIRGRSCRKNGRREWFRALLRRVILQRPHVKVLRCLTKAFLVQLNPLVLDFPVPAFLFENIVGNYTGLEGGNVCNVVNNEFPSIKNTFVLGNNQDGPLTEDINIIILSHNEFRFLSYSVSQELLTIVIDMAVCSYVKNEAISELHLVGINGTSRHLDLVGHKILP